MKATALFLVVASMIFLGCSKQDPAAINDATADTTHVVAAEQSHKPSGEWAVDVAALADLFLDANPGWRYISPIGHDSIALWPVDSIVYAFDPSTHEVAEVCTTLNLLPLGQQPNGGYYASVHGDTVYFGSNDGRRVYSLGRNFTTDPRRSWYWRQVYADSFPTLQEAIIVAAGVAEFPEIGQKIAFDMFDMVNSIEGDFGWNMRPTALPGGEKESIDYWWNWWLNAPPPVTLMAMRMYSMSVNRK